MRNFGGDVMRKKTTFREGEEEQASPHNIQHRHTQHNKRSDLISINYFMVIIGKK